MIYAGTNEVMKSIIGKRMGISSFNQIALRSESALRMLVGWRAVERQRAFRFRWQELGAGSS